MKTLAIGLCAACLSIEAAHYQTSMEVVKMNEHEYLVEMVIAKVNDDATRELVATPNIVCTGGTPAQLTIVSDAGTLEIQVEVGEVVMQKNITASVIIKEYNEIVFQNDNVIHFSNF